MHGLSFAFLALVLLMTATRLWLLGRHATAVRRHRGTVPAPFAGSVSPDDHRRAADYTLAHAAATRIDILLDALVLLALTLGGGITAIDALWQPAGLPALWQGTAVIGSVFLVTMMADLPLSLWRTFRIEARFGFNRMTLADWFADLGRSLLLGIVLGGTLVIAILWLMQRAGTMWWLPAFGVWLALVVTLSWAWPVLIAPIFNRFTPLPEGELRTRVERLIERCGFASRGVFVMDGSRRSTHGNAYFTGLGRHKRIVFFDTLLERLDPAEIEAVLAHELGHFRLHHVRKRLVLTVFGSFAAFALLGWLAGWPAFHAALGVAVPSNHAALLLFVLAGPAFTYFLKPVGAAWSRRHEFEADGFAATHAPAADLSRALVKLYRDNASTLTPDPVYAAFYYSHPPALQRIERLGQAAPQPA